MISEKLLGKINDQIQKEFYSAFLYLSMESYFSTLNLNGFENFFRVQFQEEKDHAMKFFDYLKHVGGKASLQAIQNPPIDFESPVQVCQMALEHEKIVTASIYELVDLAHSERDHKTATFLQWFVTEQAEEESTFENIVAKLNLIGKDGSGILLLNSELAARVYTPAPANGNA